MTPDAIIVFSAGIMPLEGGGWRTTTYDESDAFGTLGGRDRVEAAALLAKKYPGACLVATSQVYADELQALGVRQRNIVVQGEPSPTTQAAIVAALRLAQEKGWRHLLFVSSEYHLPRIAALYEQMRSDITADPVSSESVLMQHDPSFAEYFEKVKKTAAYETRLAAEARGVAAVKSGTYHSARMEDKKERRV